MEVPHILHLTICAENRKRLVASPLESRLSKHVKRRYLLDRVVALSSFLCFGASFSLTFSGVGYRLAGKF